MVTIIIIIICSVGAILLSVWLTNASGRRFNIHLKTRHYGRAIINVIGLIMGLIIIWGSWFGIMLFSKPITPPADVKVETSQPQWSMSPPSFMAISDWGITSNGKRCRNDLHRWIKIGNSLAIESKSYFGFSSVSFVPPEIAAELERNFKVQPAETAPLQPQQQGERR